MSRTDATATPGLRAVQVDDPRQVFARVPFMNMLQMRRDHSQGGKARMSIDARAELGNVIGALHGGVVVTLMDVAMASAAVSHVDFSRTAVSLTLTTSFLAPGTGTLTCDGELLSSDGQVAYCSAIVRDEAGRTAATGQGSFRYLPLPVNPWPSPEPRPNRSPP